MSTLLKQQLHERSKLSGPKQRSFSRRLWLAFGLVVLLMVATGFWFYRNQRDSLQTDLAKNLEAIAELKEEQITQWRNERLADAYLLTDSQLLTSAISEWIRTRNPAVGKELLQRFALSAKYQHYRNVSLTDPNGKILLDLNKQTSSVNEGREVWDKAIKIGQPALTDLTAGPERFPHLNVLAPITIKQGEKAETVGMIVLECDARDFLYPLIQSWPGLSNSAETLLVRREGDSVLYLNDLLHQRDTALKLRLPLTRTDITSVMALTGRQNFVIGRDYRGVNVVSVGRPIPDSTWYVITKIDADEAFAAWKFRSVMILGLILALIVAAGAVTQLLWSRKLRFLRYARNLIEANLDPLVTIGPDGKISDVNKAASQITGLDPNELVGSDFLVYFTEPDKAVAAYEQTLSEGSVRDIALELKNQNGATTPVLCNASLYFDENGEIAGVLAAARDNTAQKLAEKILTEKNELLEKAVHAKDRFLATMSHELRTPLNSIIGFTGTLLMGLPGPINETQNEQLTVIQTSSRRLLSLIDDLLNLAKIESGKVELTLEPVLFQKILKDVEVEMEPLARRKGLAFELQMPEENIWVESDARIVSQILLKLTENAIRYTDHGGVDLQLMRSICGDRAMVQVAVVDSGKGVCGEDQGLLFKPFPVRERPDESTGLGLYLSKLLAGLISGNIEVQSECGKGSIFSLLVPQQHPVVKAESRFLP